MNRRTLLRRLSSGAIHNVSFSEMTDLLSGFGFRLARVNGSHHIFSHPDVDELVNLREVRREAKPYQIRQALRLIERYSLDLED